MHALLVGKRAVVVGVPGAFTPVCTREHVPGLVAQADRLRASGVDYVICVTPDNPWVTKAWSHEVDPAAKLMFLSDDNLALARALGVNVVDQRLCLGETSSLYMLLVDRGLVRRLSVEPRVSDLTCTRAQDVVFID